MTLKLNQRISIGFGVGVVGLIIISLLSLLGFQKMYNETKNKEIKFIISGTKLDHVVWVNTVINAIVNHDIKKAEVQTDYHKCNLGKWYYSEERQLAQEIAPYLTPYLSKLEKPHIALHNSVVQVNEFLADDKQDQAEIVHLTTIVPVLDEIVGLLDGMLSEIDKNSTNDNKLIESIRNTQKSLGILSTFFSIFLIIFAILLRKNIISILKKAIGIISSSTKEIAVTIQQQERTASQQSSAVNETTTTMEELGVSSRQSAEQIELATQESETVLKAADKGLTTMENTQRVMSELRMNVKAIAEQILHLSEQINQIGNVTSIVRDIASQVNLLALNASVEAARAGDHGKGFAVVASEIRKLADQSRNSAEKIDALVNDIQKATNSTVMTTEEGTKTVNVVAQVAQEAIDVFNNITDSANTSTYSAQQINLNIQQQAAALDQVVQAMASINIGAQETSSGINQIKIGIEKTDEATQYLSEIV